LVTEIKEDFASRSFPSSFKNTKDIMQVLGVEILTNKNNL